MGEKPIKTIIIKKEALKPFIMPSNSNPFIFLNKHLISDNKQKVFRLDQPIRIPVALSNQTVKLDDKIIIVKKEELNNGDLKSTLEDAGKTLSQPSENDQVSQMTNTGSKKISTITPGGITPQKTPASKVKVTNLAPSMNNTTETKELITRETETLKPKVVPKMQKIKILTTEILPNIVIGPPRLEIISNVKLESATKTEGSPVKQELETQHLGDSNQDMPEDETESAQTSSSAPAEAAASSWQGKYEEAIMGKPEVEQVEPSDDWECPMCNELFNTEQEKDEHMNAEHTFYYECIECGHTTEQVELAREHFMSQHRSEQDVEEAADEDTSDVQSEKTHIQVFTVEGGKKEKKTWKCSHCSILFCREQLYRQHIVKHEPKHELPDHFCWECNMLMSSAEAYNRHILTARKHKPHRKTIPNGCRFCGMTFPTKQELQRHIQRGHSRKKRGAEIEWPQACALCGDLQENSVKYWAHTRKMHPGEKYPLRVPYDHKCDECGKEFRCLALLKEHKNRHIGVKPYPCQKCEKSFYTKLSWQTHQTAHSDNRPFRCPTCQRAFKFKHGLDRHQLVHTGERPFQCSLCGRGFTTLHWTQMHVRRVHNNEYIPYKPRHRNKKTKRAPVEPVDWSEAEEEYDGIDDEVEIHSTGFV